MNFFLFFFWFLSTLCVCRLSIRFDLLPPPSIESRCIFERKKKWINGQLRSVCHFSQAFIGECDGDSDVLFFCWFVFFFFTRSSSTYTQGAADFIFQPCNSNFGHFFLFIFTFSYQLIFFPSPLVQKVFVGLTPNTSDNKCKKKKKKQFLRS